MDISILTVNWNGAKHVKHMIETLQRHTKNISYEIIVVDNDSKLEDKQILKTLEAQLKAQVILHSKNSGFGKGNNIGAKKATGKYIAFINPDIEFQEDTLNILFNELETNEKIGLIGPKLLTEQGKIVFSAMKKSNICSIALGQLTLPPAKALKLKTAGNFFVNQNEPTFCDWIYGSFMMLPRKVFDKVGGFDEQYFMYAEEADLCLSVKKAGYLVKYEPTTKVVHIGEAVARTVPELTIRRKAESEFKFLSKWNGKWYAYLNCVVNGCLFWLKGVIYLLANRETAKKMMKMGKLRLKLLFTR